MEFHLHFQTNHPAAGILRDRANAIGEFTVGALTLENGGVYDWEISDFTNAGNDAKAGVDWDLLKFDSLHSTIPMMSSPSTL